MKKEDIQHLATLARIKLADEEADMLAGDITEILQYVQTIEEITETANLEKKVGVVNTVLREDGEPHEGGKYTEDLLAEAPERDRNYIKVKKILGGED